MLNYGDLQMKLENVEPWVVHMHWHSRGHFVSIDQIVISRAFFPILDDFAVFLFWG